jgi:hypothetical protein
MLSAILTLSGNSALAPLMLMYAQGDIEIQIEFHSLLSEYQSFDK